MKKACCDSTILAELACCDSSNLASICTVCKNADAADLRCQQCHVEICHECDMVEHWGAVKSQHRRVAVSDEEKDWRVRKKDFDRRLAENRASALMLELE